MFSYEKELKDLISCPHCENILSDPRIVQCGSTLCNCCIEKLINQEANEFRCPACRGLHEIPEKGFVKNETCSKLIEKTKTETSRKQTADDLKAKLNELKQKTDKLNAYLERGPDKVKEYCDLIRIEVQLATESTIEDLSKCKQELMSDIDQYEQKCAQIYEHKAGYKVDFEKTVEDMYKFRLKWGEYLKSARIEDEAIKNAMDEADKCLQIVEKEYDVIKNKIFNSEVLTFERSEKKLDSSFIGQVKHGEGAKKFELRQRSLNLKECLHNYSPGSWIQVKALKNTNFVIAYQDFKRPDIDLLTINKKGKVVHRRNAILNNEGSSTSINDCQITVINDFIYVFVDYYDDYFGAKYKLIKYDEHLCFVKERNFNHSISSMCTYHNEIFCLSKSALDHEILYVYDLNLNIIGSFGQKVKQAPYFFSNTITKLEVSEKYFILLDNKVIKVMNRDDGLISKEFKIGSDEFMLFMGSVIASYDTRSKMLILHDLEGNSKENKVEKISNDSKLVDCLDDKLVFYDTNRSILQFQQY